MRELVPIRVKIRRKAVRRGALQNAWPDFNLIMAEMKTGMDWAHYIDLFGIGWHYSQDGFGQGDDPFSHYAATLVPEPFAREAAASFPDQVSLMTEADWIDFHDNDANVIQPDELIDLERLQGIALKQQLGIPLTQADQDAIDPSKDAPGVRANKEKRWSDRAQTLNVRVKDS